MQAFIERASSTPDHKAVLQFLRDVISVLEWGRVTWKDIPDRDRGIIFSSAFVRGVKRFYLSSYFKVGRGPSNLFLSLVLTLAYAQAYRNRGSSKGYSLEEADELARTMIEECEAPGCQPTEEEKADLGFYGAFYVYPLAEAYA